MGFERHKLSLSWGQTTPGRIVAGGHLALPGILPSH